MQDFEKQYYRLFGAMSDAIEALEKLNIGDAREILINAQLDSEERYIEESKEGVE